MSSTQVVRDIFELSKKERVFDDFSCAFKHTILLHGRLYLTENYVCFYSNILGIKHKLKLELKKIKEIKKKNTLGLLPNALKITSDDGQAYKFSSFSKRNVAYKAFVALWRNVSEYAKNAITEDDPSEETESEPEEMEVKEEEKVAIDPPTGAVGISVVGADNTAFEAAFEEPRTPLSKARAKTELPCVPSTQDLSRTNKNNTKSGFSKDYTPNFGEQREKSKTAKDYVMRQISVPDESKASSQSGELTINLGPNDKPESKGKQNSAMSEASVNKKGELTEVSESAVQELMDKDEKTETENDVIQEIIPISLNNFWDNFLADNAVFSLGDFLIENKEKNVETGKWEEYENTKEENNAEISENQEITEPAQPQSPTQPRSQVKKLKRELNFTATVKGVPFCSSTKCNKQYKTTKSPTEIEMVVEVRTPDVPYGGYFYLQERWKVGCPVPNGDKVYLKIFISVKIVKPTMFEKKISLRSTESYKEVMNLWLESCKKRKLFQVPGKKSKSDSYTFDHEVEEVGRKGEEQKEIQETPKVKRWISEGKDLMAEKIKSIKDKFTSQGDNRNNNTILAMLVLFIVYLLWQIYTLQSALIK